MLKLYLYGHLNQVPSSRRLEREARRNTELMWLTGKLAPDFKTIADFRRDNGEAIRSACSAFVAVCRSLADQAKGGLLVAPALDQHVQHHALVIHRAPEPALLTA